MHAIHPLHYSNSLIGRDALPGWVAPLVFIGYRSPFPDGIVNLT